MKPRAAPEVASLLMAGALKRLLGALAIIGVLWLAVRWATTGGSA